MATEKQKLNQLNARNTGLTNRSLLEYAKLRKDNRFKLHPEGKRLFLRWRLGLLSDVDCGQTIELSVAALKQLRFRLKKRVDGSTLAKTNQKFATDVKAHHAALVKEMMDLNESTNEEFTGEIMSEINVDLGKKKSKNFFVEGNIYELLGVDEEARLEKVALMVHKRMSFDLFAMFNRAKIKAMAVGDRRAIEWMRMADSLSSTARPFLLDIIDKYGQLHGEAIIDVQAEQEERLKNMMNYIMSKHPDEIMEMMAYLNGLEGNKEMSTIYIDPLYENSTDEDEKESSPASTTKKAKSISKIDKAVDEVSTETENKAPPELLGSPKKPKQSEETI